MQQEQQQKALIEAKQVSDSSPEGGRKITDENAVMSDEESIMSSKHGGKLNELITKTIER